VALVPLPRFSIFGFAPIFSVLGIYGGILNTKMVNRLNATLPPERRYNVYWWHAFKHMKFAREYRQVFPGDDLSRRLRIVHWLNFAVLVLAVVVLLNSQ
jgi:hypothetical protein